MRQPPKVPVAGDKRPLAVDSVSVGFVGLGTMGAHMARRLCEAGFSLTAYDVDHSRSQWLQSRGARAAERAAGVADGADIVLFSLPGPIEVEDVVLGSGELLAAMKPRSTLVSLSTVSPELVQRIAADALRRGVWFVDAPVSGAADGAAAGALIIMAGAEPEALERCRLVLKPLAAQIFHVGPVGSGSVAKLLTNILWAIHVVALSDALVVAAKKGLDLSIVADVIRTGAAGSWVAEHDLPNILAGDDDLSFTLALCKKDLGLIARLIDDAGIEVPLLAPVLDRFEAAYERFGPRAGELAVTRVAEAAAGVSIRLSPRS